MTPEIQAAIYDAITPGWSEARLASGNHEVSAPYREDRHPSMHIHPEKFTWIDRGTGEGGGAVDLARRVLGKEATRQLLRDLARGAVPSPSPALRSRPPVRQDARAHEVEDLGPLRPEQREALVADGRILSLATPDRAGMRFVRARFRNDGGTWRCWSEYVAIPTLADGTFKLWGVHADGRIWRNTAGRLARLNAGGVSIAVSPDIHEGRCGVPRLWDLEGESDLVAAIDHGITCAIATTGGAGTLQGHDRHEAALLALQAEEVAVVRDLDDAGIAGAEKVGRWWLEHGVPVRVVALPESLGKGGDVRDFLIGRVRGRT